MIILDGLGLSYVISSTFREDIEQIISGRDISWREMSGASIFITGATGLIGSLLVRVLAAANDKYDLNLKIIGHGRNSIKGEALCQECGIEFIGSNIRKPIPVETLPPTLEYIFHCAAITRSADMVSKPVDVIATAIDGTRNVLEIAKGRHCKSVVYLSSMEIYGQIERAEVTENDLGYIDLSAPRSSYPESKRMCESLCAAYAAQCGIPVKIARLAQTFGAGTAKDDTRVFAQFVRSVIADENIILHTEGKSRGNYCYTSDAIGGLLIILLKGENKETYNVANPYASMTISKMADLVAKEICGGQIKSVIDIPKDIRKHGYASDVGFTLNVDKLGKLGWKPRYGLADMYRRMIADWQEE